MALKVGITHSLRLLAGLFLSLAPLPSLAVTVSQPYPIVPHTNASSSQVQADFSALYSTINGYIDAANLSSSNGIYASQIIPTSSGQATFGGSQSYIFPNSLSVVGGITTNGFINNAPATITGNVAWGGSGTGGTLYSNGDINHTRNLNTGGNANITGSITTNGLVNNSNSTLTGAVSAPGGISTSTIGAGTSITNNGPLNNAGTINANNTGTSLVSAGAVTINGALTGTTAGFSGTVTSTSGSIVSQVLPAYIDGSSVTGRLNAHLGAFTITASGATSSGSFQGYDSIPRCTISSLTSGGGSPSIQPLTQSTYLASNLVSGQSYTVICVGV